MTQSEYPRITIIIPCYNEEKTIENVISQVELNISQNTEIIVIDDFSSDGSVGILKNIANSNRIKLIEKKLNEGKGSCIHMGLEQAKGDIIIIQDADLEYSPSDYRKLLIPFEQANADVVFGSRFLGGGKYVRVHFFWHYLANKILTFLCNLFTNLNMTDMETGYKVFKRSAIEKINLKEKSFGFEPEVTIKLAKKKYKFFEVPISYNGRSYEEGKKIGLKDAFIAVFCIIKYSLIS